uniref:Uncharacterized protein n=1 Tax=Arundo donax TaxID=35708 RepID=A0A0A9HQW6_ARUDO
MKRSIETLTEGERVVRITNRRRGGGGDGRRRRVEAERHRGERPAVRLRRAAAALRALQPPHRPRLPLPPRWRQWIRKDHTLEDSCGKAHGWGKGCCPCSQWFSIP